MSLLVKIAAISTILGTFIAVATYWRDGENKTKDTISGVHLERQGLSSQLNIIENNKGLVFGGLQQSTTSGSNKENNLVKIVPRTTDDNFGRSPKEKSQEVLTPSLEKSITINNTIDSKFGRIKKIEKNPERIPAVTQH